jgi:1-deoxy-D-xylulose-5-phosphate synthase
MEKDLIIILNDNELSISRSIGALSRYLNRILTNPAYNRIRKDVEKVLKRIPRFGFRAYRAARRLEEGLKNLLVPGMLFEEMGFRYFGPMDGHNIAQLVSTFRNIMNLNEPILIHTITKKGKGYRFAEEDPAAFHSTGPFDIVSGGELKAKEEKTFTEAFGEKMVELAEKDAHIIGITAAMVDGTGLNEFARLFPKRFFDVGISEPHAIGFAAGLARGGFRPVAAIYSTFLQRSYDQIIHDVCLQDLPVVMCLDRAGLVGEDGPTHHGSFDLAYLRHIPNLVLMAPKDPEELKEMLELAVSHPGPAAIRYPKGSAKTAPLAIHSPVKLGKAEVLKEGRDLAIISLGCMAGTALESAVLLSKKRIDAMVVNARFVNPLDRDLMAEIAANIKRIVTIEDGVLEGGFGSAVLEFIEQEGCRNVRVRRFGLPGIFIEHGSRTELFSKYNLTAAAVCDVIIREVMG